MTAGLYSCVHPWQCVLCVCVWERGGREDEGNACCHQNQRERGRKKERAESGPVTCFFTDTQTDLRTRAGRYWLNGPNRKTQLVSEYTAKCIRNDFSPRSWSLSANRLAAWERTGGSSQQAPGWHRGYVGSVFIQPDDYYNSIVFYASGIVLYSPLFILPDLEYHGVLYVGCCTV